LDCWSYSNSFNHLWL